MGRSAALWFPPGTDFDGVAWEQFHERHVALAEQRGVHDAHERLSTIDEWWDEHREQCMGDGGNRAFWLLLLATESGARGQGLASRHLTGIVQRADAQQAPCFIECTSRSNLAFYQKFGFAVHHQATMPQSDGLTVWFLLREPRPSTIATIVDATDTSAVMAAAAAATTTPTVV